MVDTPIHDSRDTHIISPNNPTKKVTTTTDGSKERLDVSAQTVEGVGAFTTELDHAHDLTIELNTSTDTSIFSHTDTGKLDFIEMTCTSGNWEAIIKMDGVEKIRIDVGALDSDHGLTNGDSPVWATTASKRFRIKFPGGGDFLTSFELLAKATSLTPDITSYLVMHREQT